MTTEMIIVVKKVYKLETGPTLQTLELQVWLGHVEKMEDNAMPKRMLKGRLYSESHPSNAGYFGYYLIYMIFF
jgi:hypothetical protein